MVIFKILTASQWADLRAQGETQGAPIDVADGYVHFSTADQAAETAAKHFAGQSGLVLLAYDSAALGDALKWEVSRGGALFPHLYAPLRLPDMLWQAPLPLVDGTHVFPEGLDDGPGQCVDPTRDQFDLFKGLDRDEPCQMLNLVRLRGRACYPAGHALHTEGLTGQEAYARYGRDSGPVLSRVGGHILWRGAFRTTLIGPQDEAWDHVFVAHYPSAHAFMAMVKDPDYAQAVLHRQAAVLTSRLIRCAPNEAGEVFG